MRRQEFASRLRRLRTERGWNQSHLGQMMANQARQLGRPIASVPVGTISTWENGHRYPDPFYALVLCNTLNASPEALALEEVLTPATVEGIHASARRQKLLSPATDVQSILRGASVVLPAVAEHGRSTIDVDWERLETILYATHEIDETAVNDLRRLTDLYGSQRQLLATRVMLPVLNAHITSLRILMGLATSESVKRELAILAGETAICVGQGWHGRNDLGEAISAYNWAVKLGEEFKEQSLVAKALTSKSMLYSTPLQEGLVPGADEALTMLGAAARAVGPSTSPYLRAWIHGTRAYKHAGMGDTRQCGRALQECARALSQASSPPRGFYCLWGKDWHTVHRGKCALLMRDADEGRRLFQLAIDATPAELETTRATLMVGYGIGCLDGGDVDEAVAVLATAANLAARTGLAIAMQRILKRTAGIKGHPEVTALRTSVVERMM